MKKSLLSSAAALFLGLGLAVAAWAEPVDGEVRKVDPDAGKVTLKRLGSRAIGLQLHGN